MALTRNVGSTQAAKFGYIQSYTAGAAIWRGAVVVLRLATADDKVYPADGTDTTDAFKQLVIGFAMEAAAADGAAIRVRQDGRLKLKFPSIPASVIGRLACILDDESVQLYGVSTCKVVAGRITEKSSTHVFVDLADRPMRLATSLTD